MTIKPLNALTHKPSGTSTANPKTGNSFVESPQPKTRKDAKAPNSIDNYEHHSTHTKARSEHYLETVVGTTDTGQYGDKAIARLNPTKVKPAIRSWPGLTAG